MKAAVFEAPYKISIQEVEKPTPKADEALVKVVLCGICGGDLHYYDGTHPYANYPQVYGHEMVGIIEKIGEESNDFFLGDIVTGEILLPCGKCYPCRHGKYNCCANLNLIGVHRPGAYAEYVIFPIINLHKIPKILKNESAVLIEPYAIGYHCIERSQIVSKETAVVLGTGVIGLAIVDILKTMDVSVIAVDQSEFRLNKSIEVGADYIIDTRNEDLLKRIMELTNNEGAGYVFEATGNPKLISMTQNLTAAGGVITIVGISNKNVEFLATNFTKREMTIKGSRNSLGAFEPVIKLMVQGKLHQDLLVTNTFDFMEIGKAFQHLKDNMESECKVVIRYPL